jgi:threonyl-tRNA synthetase
MEWIHYIIIIGEKEVANNIISIRDRINKSNYESTIEDLIEKITNQIRDKPFLPINLPELLSNRPKIMN